MPFSLLDLEKNVTCDGMNFTHLTWLMLLLYLVKVETPKMHVNINLSLNATKWLANAPNYIDSFIKCSTNEQ